MTPTPLNVADIIARELNVESSAIHSTTKLDALGLDSLEFLELIQQIETESGHKIPDEIISKSETVADLERAVA